jgi:hypothetical protein
MMHWRTHVKISVKGFVGFLGLLLLIPVTSFTQWTHVQGLAQDIGAGGDEVWIVGTNDVGNGNFGILRWNGSGWEPKPGGAVRIAVGPAGLPWIVAANGAVSSWSGNGWAPRAQIDAIDIAVCGKGTFVLDRNQELYKLDLMEHGWERQRVVGRARWSRLAAHPNGSVWVVSGDDSPENPGSIYVFPPGTSECRNLPGSAAHDIGIGKNGSVWSIGRDPAGSGYGIYQWRGRDKWAKLNGAGEQISVDGNGIAWIVARDHTIWRCAAGDVLPLPTPGGRIAFFNESGYVARYTVTYVVDKKPFTLTTGNVTLGQRREFELPPNAINVKVKGEGKTGLVWEPWRTTFEKTYKRAPTICFKSFGTTLNQNWNNNCEAAVTKDDMDKFWEIIGAL